RCARAACARRVAGRQRPGLHRQDQRRRRPSGLESRGGHRREHALAGRRRGAAGKRPATRGGRSPVGRGKTRVRGVSSPAERNRLVRAKGGGSTVYPASFEYFAPTKLDEVTEILESYDGDAKVLAGGQSLIPMMKLRFAAPSALVDVNGVSELGTLTEENGGLRFGALPGHKAAGKAGLLRGRFGAARAPAPPPSPPLLPPPRALRPPPAP